MSDKTTKISIRIIVSLMLGIAFLATSCTATEESKPQETSASNVQKADIRLVCRPEQTVPPTSSLAIEDGQVAQMAMAITKGEIGRVVTASNGQSGRGTIIVLEETHTSR